MLSALQPSLAESLCEVWAVLHKDASFRILDSELHYLTSMALGAEDAISHLLLKKLRLAETIAGPDPAGTVTMNSYVEFTFGCEDKRFAQVVHPSTAQIPPYGLSITSLEGAGLIGLVSGQVILWPDDEGRLHDLHVVRTENCPGPDSWLHGQNGGL